MQTNTQAELRQVPAAIAVLLAEHEIGYREIEAVQQAVAAADPAQPDSVLAAFEQAEAALRFLDGPLEIHIAKEEGPLFPRLKAALPAGDRLIDEMVAEHDLIRMKRDDLRELIEELLTGHDDLDADRDALRHVLRRDGDDAGRLDELRQIVATTATKLTVHFENEEELVFPLAPQLLDPATLDAIADEMVPIS